jgi:hypothetical protein
MDDLRLGRPAPLLRTQEDDSDGLFLDSKTALRQDVLGLKEKTDPQLSRKVEPLPDNTQAAAPVPAPISFAFPASLAGAPIKPVSQPKQTATDSPSISFAVPGSWSEPAQTETQKPAEPASGPTARGLKAGGIDSAKEMAVGGAALLADTVGAKETSGKLYDSYKGIKEESQKDAQDYESFSNVMDGKASFGDFFKYWGGYAVGQAAQTLVAAGAGAAVGSVLPGAGTVAGAVEGTFARGAAQTGIKKLIAAKLEGEVAKNIAVNAGKGMAAAEAEKLAYTQAAQSVMKGVGAAAAVSGQNLAMEGASIYGDAKDAAKGGDVDLGRVWTGAVLAAATDTVSDLFAVKGLTKALGGNGLVRNLAVESFKGGLRESTTEAVQTGFERFGAGKDLATSEAIRDYIDSAAAGAVGGVLFGAGKGAFGKKGGEGEDQKMTIEQARSMFEQKLSTEDGRAEVFAAFQDDPKVAAALRAAGIESSDDPRFDAVVTQAMRVKEMLSGVEPVTPEEQAKRTKERGEDVRAAYGDTASTGIGSNTGATDPVIRRDSVTPNEETKTLEGEAQPVVLPETTNQAGTVAMSPEDLVARKEGYDVMPTFQVGQQTVGNKFVSMAQAETFLLGPKNKETGQREGGYASSVDDMEFQIRQGKRAKAAGGGMFYFIEGRKKPETPSAVEQIDEAAHQAATSPLNDTPQPTEAQKKSGVYKKGHLPPKFVGGLRIAIENPAGSERSGKSPDGTEWKNTMANHYGYIKGTVGKDKDHVDVFIGGNPGSKKVFVVDQVNKDGSFDEHKALVGFNTEAEARKAYLANYTPGWTGLGAISEMPMAAFKSWVKDGVKGKPLALEQKPAAAPVAAQPAPVAAPQAPVVKAEETKAEPKAEPVVSKAEPENDTSAKHVDETPKVEQTKEEKKRSAGDRLRSALAKDNPFKAFLGRYGIKLDVVLEFAPGIKERRAFMASGYGPVFRKTGLSLDDLQTYAAERGFLPKDAIGGQDEIYALIQRAMRGEKIAPLYGDDADDILAQRMEEQRQREQEDAEDQAFLDEGDDGYEAAEREAMQYVGELDDASLFDIDDAIAIGGESNTDLRSAMLALGFTEEEINDEVARQAKEAKSVEGDGGTEQARTESPSQNSEERTGEAPTEQRSEPEPEVKKASPKVDPVKLKKAIERIDKAYNDNALDMEDEIRLKEMAESGDFIGAMRELNEIAQLNKGYKAHYRVTTVGDTGMNKADVKKVLAKMTGEWANMPNVVVLETEDDLPIKTLTRIKRAGMANKVPGIYLNGKVYLVAGNIHNANDAILTIAHEIAGHFGLRSILGEKHAETMRGLFNGNKTVRQRAEAMMVKEGLALEEATEEVLADMAEKGDKLDADAKSALRTIYAAIRKWLRETFNIAYASNNEINQLVRNARKFVVDGEGEEGKGGTKAADASMLEGQMRGKAPTFYSALERATRAAKQESAQAKDWVAIIGKLPGVREEEIKWTGVNDWLAMQTGKVTKQQVLDFIAGNKLHLNDVILSGAGKRLSDEDIRSMYADQTGTLEEDIDLTREEMIDELSLDPRLLQGTKHRQYTLAGGKNYVELIVTEPSGRTKPYKDFDEIHFGPESGGKHLGWVRMNQRKDMDGNDVLFLEEIQSQRGQDGRELGFGNEEGKVPDAPMMKDTKAWTALLLKRAIAYAQEQGINRIAWTTGEQQVDRYKLSNSVDKLTIKQNDDGTFDVVGNKAGASVINQKGVGQKELSATVGKDLANKAINDGGTLELVGEEMDIGGDGVASYYNQTVPSVVKDLIGKKEMGGKVEVMNIEGTGQQLGFVIPEKLQQIVAEDGLPMFRRHDYEAQYDDLSPKARAIALAKGHYSPPSIQERLEALKPRFWLRVVQGTFDKFRSVRDLDMKAYMKLRMSNGPQDGAVSALLHYGQVFNDDGALNIKKGTKGLLEVLQPLGIEVDRFLLWIAANRAGELKKSDREHFFKDDEIAELKKLNLGTTKDGKSRAALYVNTLQQMNELNRSVLDIARTNGLIDEAAYKRFSSDIWYVPFYRNMDDDRSLSGAQTSTAAVGQYLSKKLKGSERPLNDLMENVLMNWSHILSASMKNEAANETLNSAMQMGGIVTKLKVAEKDSVKTMVDGKEQHWRIDDEFLLASLDAVASVPSYGFWTNTAREFKTTLTRFISLSPTFKINNLIRDSVQSIGISELNKNPIANVIEGWRAYKDDRASALAGGGIFAMGNAFDGDAASNVKHLIRKGVPNKDILTTETKVKEAFKGVWDKYDEISDAMENSNRLALYNQLRANGATHLEAAYAARDLQDFSLQGGFVAVRYLSQILPYFNARLQGLYKLGRDGLDPVVQSLSGNATESERQKAAKFSAVLGAITMFGIVLYLSQKDDDDYKALEDWERDAFFWFKVPGTKTGLRIPKPFEMGAFETIVERFTEQLVDKNVEGKVFGRRLLAVFADNLAINPVPQIVRPVYDIARNKDGFTSRPIESMGMERLSVGNRVNQGTSAVAVGLGKINGMFAEMASAVTGGAINADNMQLSPIQYDYLIRGYLGWVGTAMQATSNMAVAPLKPGESSRFERIDDFLVVGNYVKTMPQGQSKYVTSFYENAKEAATAVADYQNFINLGQYKRAEAIAEEKGDQISMSKLYAKASDSLSKLNKQLKVVEDDATMSGAEKRLEIERIQQLRTDYAKQVEEARIKMARSK